MTLSHYSIIIYSDIPQEYPDEDYILHLHHIFCKKMFCNTNCRCLFFIRTIFHIRHIMIESIVRHDPLAQRNHITRQYSSNITAKYDIHIICHAKIRNQYCKIIQIFLPFLSCRKILAFELFQKLFQRNLIIIVRTLAAQYASAHPSLPQ